MRPTVVVVSLCLLAVPAHAGEGSALPDTPTPQADDTAAPIVNGQLEPGHPWAVALGADFTGDNPFSMCTGSLITPRIVLSAAHCGADMDPDLVVELGRAFVGADMDSVELSIPFEAQYIHPDYIPIEQSMDGRPQHDVSVFVLAEEVTTVEPLWIRTEEISNEEFEDSEVLSVGFGSINDDGDGNGVKRSAVLTADYIDEMFVLSSNNTNPDEANICSGDSGGPQMYRRADGRWVQLAVHSWGDQFCESISGSTRVDIHAEWILDRVEEVHGTRDLCAIDGLLGDGTCDGELCPDDPDCAAPQEDNGDDDDSGAGCRSSLAGGGSSAALPALLPLLARRRG